MDSAAHQPAAPRRRMTLTEQAAINAAAALVCDWGATQQPLILAVIAGPLAGCDDGHPLAGPVIAALRALADHAAGPARTSPATHARIGTDLRYRLQAALQRFFSWRLAEALAALEPEGEVVE